MINIPEITEANYGVHYFEKVVDSAPLFINMPISFRWTAFEFVLVDKFPM